MEKALLLPLSVPRPFLSEANLALNGAFGELGPTRNKTKKIHK